MIKDFPEQIFVVPANDHWDVLVRGLDSLPCNGHVHMVATYKLVNIHMITPKKVYEIQQLSEVGEVGKENFE